MNRHFDDARYHFGRGFKHAVAGVTQELRPVENRVRRMLGREPRPDPKRFDRLQRELRKVELRADDRREKMLRNAREQVRKYRTKA